MVQPARVAVTLEQFLVDEANDPTGVRREWIDGWVYAMSGATPEHGRLCTAVLAELRSALRGTCTVRDGSVAIHIATRNVALRPDASVVCGAITKTVVEKGGKSQGEALTNPCVLVEVLSETTERDDRGSKFRDYRTLTSLEEYVLVSQSERRVEVYRRANGWIEEVFQTGQSFTLHGAALAVDAIYDE
jgi:Uma2 family endonuclease